jgi:hypothetical protein
MMIIRIGLENGTEGRSQAWALDFPGCFAYGEDGPTALLQVPEALLKHEAWIAGHTQQPWVTLGDFDIRLVETWQVYYINKAYEEAADGYEVNAWFRDDWRPLTGLEIQRGLEMLSWSRADLLQCVAGLDAETLDRRYPGERWSIRGILRHVGGAEWWYLHRLGLTAGQADLPEEAFARLDVARKRLVEVLPGLAGAVQVLGIDGEIWSPRKLLRRALWHELDHIGHIYKLLLN